MKYYVYQHVNPETGEILYIGKGSYERAWMCRGSNRNPEYTKYLNQFLDTGYTMFDIVTILHKGLTNKKAEELETELIQKIQPIFNRHQTEKWSYPKKFSEEVVFMIKALKKMGYGPQNTAWLMGGDKNKNAMTMWRINNEY
jgi:excinuclease UvrABC nuclease subunit